MSSNVLLKQDFFARPAASVAKDLLGRTLVRQQGRAVLRGTIIETEAYVGPEDKACHAYRGRTKRTEVMYHEPGRWYVYLIYGMYNMLNIVTDQTEHPAAVLIRGITTETAVYNGPGKLTRALAVDRSLNDMWAESQTGLWFERGREIAADTVSAGARVGVQYAQEWADAPLRFCIERKN
jgi:DNA-3-methyladenine glycosylase